VVLASCVLNSRRQLASGKRSRAENSGGHRRKNDVLDLPFHDHSFFFDKLKKDVWSRLFFRFGCNQPARAASGELKTHAQPGTLGKVLSCCKSRGKCWSEHLRTIAGLKASQR
jgi:hypothetical protein